METSEFSVIDASPVYHPCFFIPGPHVEKLPLEVLAEVFALCADEDWPVAPLTLGTVCSTWKEIIDRSPRVWQVVVLEDTNLSSPVAAQSRARLWISRSASLQFDLKLNVKEANNVLYLLAPFLPAIDRWRQITITGACQKCICLSDTSSRRGMLNDLSVSIYEDDGDNHTNTGDTTAIPRLKYTGYRWQNYLDMNMFCLTHLPRASQSSLAPLRFTSLSMTDKNFYRLHVQPLRFTEILSLLETCPHLESFTFHGWMFSQGSQSFPVVSLPSLRTLNIHETPCARVMLSKIYAPVLSELYLVDLSMHLNPDYLQGLGDSEDDNDEYLSRERWSDRATGVGLRTLIAHCNPPLKTLVMAFSDMRVKDYIHVFDRLTELEDLRITAAGTQVYERSDMVISLLRPYAAASISPLHCSLNVRLPHLRHLEIRECPCMSGDTIVETLLQRVAFTDQLAFTLEVVIISKCEQFGVQHQDRLNRELGPRLRSQLNTTTTMVIAGT
ncbi:hypothetical protein F5878DRAFT_609612 [Lentinula raphanica]|uniref:F-box domain-containing protein n=1 Tax=Lentinula raphanica TaxID=153919 RepID=A0AA38PFI2_9AGAR|nr:hypothetical protein F5878DRAFT_609612 [Lentinula raphanica]